MNSRDYLRNQQQGSLCTCEICCACCLLGVLTLAASSSSSSSSTTPAMRRPYLYSRGINCRINSRDYFKDSQPGSLREVARTPPRHCGRGVDAGDGACADSAGGCRGRGGGAQAAVCNPAAEAPPHHHHHHHHHHPAHLLEGEQHGRDYSKELTAAILYTPRRQRSSQSSTTANARSKRRSNYSKYSSKSSKSRCSRGHGVAWGRPWSARLYIWRDLLQESTAGNYLRN